MASFFADEFTCCCFESPVSPVGRHGLSALTYTCRILQRWGPKLGITSHTQTRKHVTGLRGLGACGSPPIAKLVLTFGLLAAGMTTGCLTDPTNAQQLSQGEASREASAAPPPCNYREGSEPIKISELSRPREYNFGNYELRPPPDEASPTITGEEAFSRAYPQGNGSMRPVEIVLARYIDRATQVADADGQPSSRGPVFAWVVISPDQHERYSNGACRKMLTLTPVDALTGEVLLSATFASAS